MNSRQRHSSIIEPRVLRREVAAHYLSISPTSFDSLVDGGLIPPPKTLKSRIKIWDRRALDRVIDDLFDDADAESEKNPYDEISLRRPNG